MLPKPIEEVVLADLQDLVTNSVTESRTMEYKSDLSLNGREERREFLADVTALANTAGGDILFGVEETNGEPTDIAGIDVPSWDELQRQLLSLIRDGTQPRLQGVQLHQVQTATGRTVVALRVPRSYGRPHRVVFGGHGHFYGRDASQKFRLDVEDLRRAFTQAAAIGEVAERFRTERTEALKQNRGFSPISGPPRAVLHFLPERALLHGPALDAKDLERLVLRPLPRAALGFSTGFALDAVYWHNEHAYTAMLRTGAIEAAEGLIVRKKTLFPTPLQQEIISATGSYLGALKQLEVDPPITVLLTLIGVDGFTFPAWSIQALSGGHVPLATDVLELPGLVLDSLDVEPASAFRPLFDRLWNAFGYARCQDYDETGAWSPKERPILA